MAKFEVTVNEPVLYNAFCWIHSLATSYITFSDYEVSAYPVSPRRASVRALFGILFHAFTHYLPKLLRVLHGLVVIEAHLTPVQASPFSPL